jgi:hypothetical protein
MAQSSFEDRNVTVYSIDNLKAPPGRMTESRIRLVLLISLSKNASDEKLFPSFLQLELDHAKSVTNGWCSKQIFQSTITSYGGGLKG